MPPAATGSLSINESGPYHYGDIISFTFTTAHLSGGHPMVEVSGYQDLDGDGQVTIELTSGDLGWLTLNGPAPTPVVLPNTQNYDQDGNKTGLDISQPAKFRAALYSYGWKGKQEYVVPLDSLEFDVS